MPSNPQKRAIAAHRRRLTERDLGRFEVRGLEADKDPSRGIARRLAANDDAAGALLGADLDLSREETPGCDAGL